MKIADVKTALLAVTTAVLMSGGSLTARADIKDYEFQLVKNEVKKGDGTIVEVRLLNKKTNKPVPGAVIFAKRIDMAPDGMETMAGPIELLPSSEPGVYRFKTGLSMEGRWQLSLGAKVQGETESLQSKLIVKALP
jgi:hypothetical protein